MVSFGTMGILLRLDDCIYGLWRLGGSLKFGDWVAC